MSSLLDRLADTIVEHRWIVLGILLLVTAVIGAGLHRLETNFSVDEIHGLSGAQQQALEEVRETFGADERTLVVLVSADDIFRPAALAWIREASRSLKDLDGIARVESITETPVPQVKDSPRGDNTLGSTDPPIPSPASLTPPSLKEMLSRLAKGEIRAGPVLGDEPIDAAGAERLQDALSDAPLIRERLVSPDAGSTLVVAQLDEDVESNADVAEVVSALNDWLAEHPAPEGVEVRPAGLPYINATIIERMKRDQTILLPGSLLLALLLLFVAFRWWPAIYLPVVAVVCSAIMIVGAMGWLGVPVDILNNIVPVMVVIIGITDAIHLVHRYGDYLDEDLVDASKDTFRSMAVACFLTSFTTAVGFVSLVVSETTVLQRFGLVAAGGVVLAYVVIITLVPAMLPAVGQPPERVRNANTSGKLNALLERMADMHLRRPWAATAAFLVLAAPVAIYGVTQLEVDNAVLDQFDPKDEIYQTVRRLEAEGFGVRTMDVVFRSAEDERLLQPDFLNRLHAFEKWADEQPGVQQTSGPTELLHEIWYLSTGNETARGRDFTDADTVDQLRLLAGASGRSPLQRHLSSDGEVARLEVSVKDVGDQATLTLAEDLRNRAEESVGALDGVEVAVTGRALISSQAIDTLIRDLLASLALAFVVIFAFMSLVLRSVRLGLVSLPATVLPLLVTAGYMAFRGIPLNAATVIIFSISIGLAVDGAIHVLARFREEAGRGESTDEALRHAVQGTGEAVILMYAALILGFALMLTSSFVPVRRFGELVSITVLTCLFSTLVLLPPLLKFAWKDDS
ncbi:hypothetical protein FIV42_01970 [Persicimonas caeni]|uniref:SSD domain-containing protein n=1 Tax=Persicimonas caeni TaxID=2292766 RepID=A0A4Y6PMK8_PERCE|nr:efflux RND transporter permease subunit [Persicimonas caeni]QDG49546.1 hypothetical protein FIV42_01970 [Persicimonas caeni]QED30767.1 MMPL family transporter [Persicimonas caeni]